MPLTVLTADTVETLSDELQSLDDEVTAISFANYPRNLSVESSELLMKCIPPRIRYVELSEFYPGLYFAAFIALLRHLPIGVQSLSLEGNELDDLTNEAFVIMMATLGELIERIGLAHLNLRDNDLDLYAGRPNGVNALIEGFSKLTNHLRSMNLAGNELGESFASNDLIRIILAIPRKLLSLTLSDNKLSFYMAAELEGLFTALPPQLRKLNLSYNQLTMNSLGQALRGLPESLVELNLSGNAFGREDGGVGLRNFLLSVPSHIAKLRLADTALNEMNAKVLAESLAATPAHIKYLDLSCNTLSRFSLDELRLILSSIPAHVATVKLSGNGLSNGQVPIKAMGDLLVSLDKKIILGQRDDVLRQYLKEPMKTFLLGTVISDVNQTITKARAEANKDIASGSALFRVLGESSFFDTASGKQKTVVNHRYADTRNLMPIIDAYYRKK